MKRAARRWIKRPGEAHPATGRKNPAADREGALKLAESDHEDLIELVRGGF
jgi:hypothetical protein